ncbi:terminase small subunit [Pantoea phage vB_PagS_Vid5]|uniref:Terminase small subunit n=1 Tax=Pantoea phage vB_PagS_Vid5 TaxID=2099652 RepID=A0A2P1CKJ1_9CAUD|nr:terminase small subunit [Pantoea phage vB_PagS_Vid5]AVJ51756.1 terminase small subunit [Pantoea phage vB_PagS_Vid5]
MSEHQGAGTERDFTNYLIRAANLTVQEMAIRDSFVREYVFDYNGTAAALRSGFNSVLAVEYAQKFLQDPYVQWKVREHEESLAKNVVVDEDALAKLERQRLIEGLKREANYKGPGASAAARVAAHKALIELYGFNAPKNTNVNHTVGQGVMVVPAVATVENWEQAAAETQRQLAEDTNDNS